MKLSKNKKIKSTLRSFYIWIWGLRKFPLTWVYSGAGLNIFNIYSQKQYLGFCLTEPYK